MYPFDGFAGPVNSCDGVTSAWCDLGLSRRLGWAGEITAIGLGTVILMLLVLMVCLMIITAVFPPKPEEDEEEDDEPVAAAPAADATSTSDIDLAALAVAINTALGQGGPALVANKSGSGLADSRWVSVGRSMTNHTWQRS